MAVLIIGRELPGWRFVETGVVWPARFTSGQPGKAAAVTESDSRPQAKRVLVLGASGYVGGRLIPELLREGHHVRGMTRQPDRLRSRPWSGDIEIVRGDLLDPTSLTEAFAGVDVIYYLVHNLGTGDGFAGRDRASAENTRRAAGEAGIEQIVYLGGLGDENDDLSPHIRSRHTVGRVLAAGPIPVTELRAAVILGSGSASFEMLRGLVEVLPLMITPEWVRSTRCQPIGISDVVERLVVVLGRTDLRGVWEIGGQDVVSYLELMQAYADAAGLRRRRVLPLPVAAPGPSAHWVDFVTTLPRSIASELVESLQNDMVVRRGDLDAQLGLTRTPLAEALELAIAAIEDLDIPTRWTPRPGAEMARPQAWDAEWAGGTVLTDERSAEVDAPVDAVMDVVRRIGGDDGWYGFAPLWSLRALIDEVIGGPGWRRGRRHPSDLAVGDVVDVFSVERSTSDHLRLRADMKMPGWGWLEWRAVPAASGTRLEQCARFVPRGLWGRAYWISLVPFHAVIFGRMVQRIAKRAEARLTD